MSNNVSNGPSPTPTSSIKPLSSAVGSPAPFYFLTPEALMAYVEQELEHLDTNIGKEMNAIKSRNNLAQNLSEATAYLEHMKQVQSSGKGNEYYTDAFGVCENGKLATRAQNPDVLFVIPAPGQGPDPQAQAEHQAAMATLQETANELRAQGYEQQALQMEAAMQKLNDGDLTAGIGVVQTAIDSIDKVGSGLTRSNDMSMINLQQFMERRSRALTFVSNALKSMDAPADQAVRNMV